MTSMNARNRADVAASLEEHAPFIGQRHVLDIPVEQARLQLLLQRLPL